MLCLPIGNERFLGHHFLTGKEDQRSIPFLWSFPTVSVPRLSVVSQQRWRNGQSAGIELGLKPLSFYPRPRRKRGLDWIDRRAIHDALTNLEVSVFLSSLRGTREYRLRMQSFQDRAGGLFLAGHGVGRTSACPSGTSLEAPSRGMRLCT